MLLIMAMFMALKLNLNMIFMIMSMMIFILMSILVSIKPFVLFMVVLAFQACKTPEGTPDKLTQRETTYKKNEKDSLLRQPEAWHKI